MSFVITPRQLQRRADLYYQLGQLTSAGLSIMQSLEQLRRKPPTRSYRLPLGRIIDEINHGFTFSEALRRQGQWLPEFDLALIEAGEKGGRLEASFKLLGDYYADRARTANEFIFRLLYPVFLIHFAVLVFGVVAFFQPTKWKTLFLPPLAFLVLTYVGTITMIFITQSRHGEMWRACIEYGLRPMPLIGSGRKALAMSRLAGALGALLSAGITVVEAWELAAIACGSPAIKRTVLAWRPYLDEGQTPSEVVSASPRFPEVFANQYAAGEISGKLEDTLNRLRDYYQDEGTRKIRMAITWYPMLVYLLVAAMIGYFIISFYMNYFQQINSINAGF
jgi:type II secretory pathway component PulF